VSVIAVNNGVVMFDRDGFVGEGFLGECKFVLRRLVNKLEIWLSGLCNAFFLSSSGTFLPIAGGGKWEIPIESLAKFSVDGKRKVVITNTIRPF